MTIVFFIFLELAMVLPALAIWLTESIPIKIRAILLPVILFIFCLAVINKFLKISGMNYKDIGVKLPRKDEFKKNILLFFSGTLACLMWVQIYTFAFKMFLPMQYAKLLASKTTGYTQFLSDWAKTGEFYGIATLWSSLLLLTVIEELAFRGFIFNYMRRKSSLKKALLWSSVLFTFGHLNPYSFPITFVLGLVLTLLYVKSGGLAVPISVHFTYNLSVFYLDKFVSGA
ncbi:MAG: CPBP family intramembrane metalloprotease [Elusimicrobia bacterium]|nr:CPBP family intramembrane metalloprotease [Elusimicrobiota bacterium]